MHHLPDQVAIFFTSTSNSYLSLFQLCQQLCQQLEPTASDLHKEVLRKVAVNLHFSFSERGWCIRLPLLLVACTSARFFPDDWHSHQSASEETSAPRLCFTLLPRP